MEVTSTADVADKVVSAINTVTALIAVLSMALAGLASAIVRLRTRLVETRDEAVKLKSSVEVLVRGTEDALAPVEKADPKLYRQSKAMLRAAITKSGAQEVIAPVVEEVIHGEGGKPHGSA